MNELAKYEAYKKKLSGICDKAGLTYSIKEREYPFRVTVRPVQGVEGQMSMLEHAEDEGFTSPDAYIAFSFPDGDLQFKMDQTISMDDNRLTKLKNLAKNLYSTWTGFFYKDIVIRQLLSVSRMPTCVDPVEKNETGQNAKTERVATAPAEPLEELEDDGELPGDDDVLHKAIALVRTYNRCDTKLLSAELDIGTVSANDLIQDMVEEGIVAYNGTGYDVLPGEWAAKQG